MCFLLTACRQIFEEVCTVLSLTSYGKIYQCKIIFYIEVVKFVINSHLGCAGSRPFQLDNVNDH